MKLEKLLKKVSLLKKNLQNILNEISDLENEIQALKDLPSEKESSTAEMAENTAKPPGKIKRISSEQEEEETIKDNFKQPKYDIKVVGLGVEKI